MATSLHAHFDRENMHVLPNNTSKGNQGPAGGHRRLSAKTFNENKHAQATPRRALGDLGNLQQQPTTFKKFQTPIGKPSKVKIFEDTPKTNPRKSIKAKNATFSVLNSLKLDTKMSEARTRRASEDSSLPDIENMAPFVDQEDHLATPQCIKRLLQHPKIINPSLIMPPRKPIMKDDGVIPTFSSVYEFDTVRQPCIDETMASIVGYDNNLEFCEVDDDFLPSLDDIPLDMPL